MMIALTRAGYQLFWLKGGVPATNQYSSVGWTTFMGALIHSLASRVQPCDAENDKHTPFEAH